MEKKKFTLKLSETFKARIKKESEYYSINMSQFIIQAINEKLERRTPSLAEESQN